MLSLRQPSIPFFIRLQQKWIKSTHKQLASCRISATTVTQMFVSLQGRPDSKIDDFLVFMHENAEGPPSLSNRGKLRTCTKSQILAWNACTWKKSSTQTSCSHHFSNSYVQTTSSQCIWRIHYNNETALNKFTCGCQSPEGYPCYSNETALNKFTCGCQSPEGYPCSSRPFGETNQMSTAAMERRFWKTEQ